MSSTPAGPSTPATPTARPKPRVIRTFEEVAVVKEVLAEEWYEEMECGICSHILGATQAIVPCGHSFCGPCTHQWISSNKTCPHCRHPVSSETPYVPNFLVDHIIERKVRLIRDDAHKTGLLAELLAKQETWRALQAPRRPALATAKSAPGPSSPSPSAASSASAGGRHARRASREIHLGAPLSARGLLHLDEAHRALAPEVGRQRRAEAAELRHRERERETDRERIAGERALERMEADALSAAGAGLRSALLQYTAENRRRPGMPSAASSPALASRQARGRGTRDMPLVVLSEDEDDTPAPTSAARR
ncbi:hypothetical protein Q5752_004086 [Cryptotrichosporon argae]